MHISLDSALGRPPRLIGESVFQIAPNAAAGYSLRSLTGGDPKAVRVRRSSDDSEQDFTVSEVSSGALVNFVNAEVLVNQTDASWTGWSNVGNASSSTSGGAITVTGATTANDDGIRYNAFLPLTSNKYRFVFSVSALNLDGATSFQLKGNGSNIVQSITSTGSYSVEHTVDSGGWGSFINFTLIGNASSGASITIDSLQIYSIAGDGLVATWYDQSGNSNNLTQATAAKQPTIVTGGSLNTRNSEPIVKFIQANSTFLAGASSILPTGTDIAMTIFQAMHVDASSGNRIGLFGHNGGGNTPGTNQYLTGVTGNRRTIIKTKDASDTVVTLNPTTNVSADDSDAIITYFNSMSDGTLTHAVFNLGAQVQSTFTGSITDQSYESGNTTILGARTVSDNFSDSEFFEVIVYASDQLSNRNAIEANLSSKYGIALS